MCIDCMQTVLVRCPHSATWLAGSGVGAADVVDGAEQLRIAEEMRRALMDAAAMRCAAQDEQAVPW